jgi:2-dehydropantoate 2-reductase
MEWECGHRNRTPGRSGFEATHRATFHPGIAEDRLAFCDTIPATMTSSMQVDLERGNRLELPWLSGAVVDLGARLGVPTPVNAEIVRALMP